jgi:hypothetical protein
MKIKITEKFKRIFLQVNILLKETLFESKSKPEIVRVQDLKDIANLLGMEYAQKAIEPIKSALEFLESIRGSFLIPAVPYVSLREETLHQILDTLRLKMGPKSYSEAMFQAGQLIGVSFADDLMKFLSQQNLIPQDENVLIRIWMMFDTNAGWGKFDGYFDESKKTLNIKVTDCFLSRGLTQEKDRHSRFLMGYVESIAWEIFKQYPRMFNKALRIMRNCYEPNPKNFNFKIDDDTWVFEVGMKEEVLRRSFDYFYDALEAFWKNNFDACVLNIRRSLESAFILKANFDIGEKVPLNILFDAFKDCGVQLNYGLASDIYGGTSDKIHPGSKELNLQKCKKLLDNNRKILKEIELAEITPELVEKIKKKFYEHKTATTHK